MTPTAGASGNSILMYNDSEIVLHPLLNYTTTRFGMLNAQISTVDNNEYITRGLADTLYTGATTTQSLSQISIANPNLNDVDMNNMNLYNLTSLDSTGYAVTNSQTKGLNSIVTSINDQVTTPNNHIDCTALNMVIRNTNAEQIRVMGTSDVFTSYSDTADIVTQNKIIDYVQHGVALITDPITSIIDDRQYTTKGYVDSLSGGV